MCVLSVAITGVVLGRERVGARRVSNDAVVGVEVEAEVEDEDVDGEVEVESR